MKDESMNANYKSHKHHFLIATILSILIFLPCNGSAADFDKSAKERFLNLSVPRDKDRNAQSLDSLPVDYQEIILKTFTSYEGRLLKKNTVDQGHFVRVLINPFFSLRNKDGRASMRMLLVTEGFDDIPEDIKKSLTETAELGDKASGRAREFDRNKYSRLAKVRIISNYDSAGREIERKDYLSGVLIYHRKSTEGDISEATYYYDDGKKKAYSYLKMRKGYREWYYPSGQISKKNSTEELINHGESVSYFESGKTKSIYGYKMGNLDGPFVEYHENGGVRLKGTYLNDKLNGELRELSSNGAIVQLSAYKDGVKDGENIRYSVDGKISEKYDYKNGELIGYAKYQENGAKNHPQYAAKLSSDGTVDYKRYFHRTEDIDPLVVSDAWKEKNRKKIGKAVSYNKEGKVCEEVEYGEGEIIGSTTYNCHADMAVLEKTIFNTTKNETEVTSYDGGKSGRISSVLRYSGRPSVDNQKKKISATFERYGNGKLLVREFYDTKGQLVKSENFANVNIDKITKPYLTNKSKGIGHVWLDLENDYGYDTAEARRILDRIVNDAKSRITIKSSYTKSEAANILGVIGDVIKKHNIEYDYDHVNVFSKTLVRRRMDCDIVSLLYITVGDVLGLPIYGAKYPKHMAIYWKDSSNSILWEATGHRELSQQDYFDWLINPDKAQLAVKNGVYMSPTSRDYLIGHVVNLLSMSTQSTIERKLLATYSLQVYNNPDSFYIVDLCNLGIDCKKEKIHQVIDQRLKIFGDSLLNHTVVEALIERFPDAKYKKYLVKSADDISLAPLTYFKNRAYWLQPLWNLVKASACDEAESYLRTLLSRGVIDSGDYRAKMDEDVKSCRKNLNS